MNSSAIIKKSKFYKTLSLALALILTVSAALLCGSCGKQDPDAPSGMKKAYAENAGYYIYIPTDWICDTVDGSLLTSAHVSDADYTNLTVMAYTGDMTYTSLTDYFESYKKSLVKIFDTDDEGNTDFAFVVEGETCLLGGIAARKYIYTGTVGGASLKYEQVISYYNGDYYIITFTSDIDLFDKHTEDFDLILQNFAFEKAPSTTAVLTDAPQTTDNAANGDDAAQ